MQGVKIMKKSNYPFWTIIASLGAFCAILTAGTAVINSSGARSKLALENGYRRAYYDVCDGVNNIEVNLSKLMVCSGGVETLPLLTELSAQAEHAQASLCSLPFECGDVRLTGKYLNQVGDWSRSYARAIAEKRDCRSFGEQAVTLYESCARLNESLRTSGIESAGNIVDNVGAAGRLISKDWSLKFDETENVAIDYPELIYDGPFSDAKKHDWRALDGLEKISTDEGASRLKTLLDAEEISLIGVTNDEAEIYEYSCLVGGAETYAAVTARGGYIVGFDVSREVGEVSVSESEAVSIAIEFARTLGYERLDKVWYVAQGGIGYVNLAPKTDGVTIYPELVKVKIALDGGDAIGIEAGGYCASHARRDLNPTISEKTAKSLVNPRLKVESVSLAVVPTGDSGEALCYEVRGEFKGISYFVYIDAADGSERDVMRVVESEQGSAVM